MRRFLRFTLLFIVPILACAIGLEVLIREIPNGYTFKRNHLDSNKERIETLILGSSHAFYNVNPVHLEGAAFNAANPAQSLRYDLLLIQRYIADMPHLQTVILPVGYPTLFFELGDTPENWRLTHYARDFGFPISPDHLQYRFFILSKMLKWNLEDIETHYFRKSKVHKMSDLGWGTDFSGNREGKIEKSAKASIFWHTAPNSKHVDANRRFLEQIAQLCSEKDIQLLVINPPLHPAYSERRDPDQVEVTDRVLQELVVRYPRMKVLDFSSAAGFGDGDFYDGDHLNEVGAEKLSVKINLSLRQMALEK